MIVVCEGDEISYRCAFACQRQAYKVLTSKSRHDFKDKYTKTAIVKFFKEKNKVLDVDYTLEPYLIIEPEYVVKHTLDSMVNSLRYAGKLMPSPVAVKEVQLWLSPSNQSNFRYKVAEAMGPKGVGYKAGRGPKPHYLSLVKRLLIEKHGAKELEGFEADDALGMFADSNTILSHVDKDIDMVEGWHYNHVKREVYFVEEGLGKLEFCDIKNKVIGRGLIFFYLQMLTGDATDNIPGCKNPEKAHFKKAPNISAAEGYKLLHMELYEDSVWEIVRTMYVQTYQDRWVDAVQEMADLLYIVRADKLTGRQYLKKKGFI